MDTLKAPQLKRGDIVGIIAPSSPVYSKRELTRGMRALESIGLQPRLSSHALAVRKSYEAGTRQERIRDLKEMFLDDEVQAIFCATGGYAAIQLLQDIDWKIIAENPKPFLGYSDVTTLLNAIYKKTGLITFHGPNVEELGQTTKRDKYTLQNLESTLIQGKHGPVNGFTDWKTLRPGQAEGVLVGGNLDVLLALVGTSYEPDWDGKILFWEEDSDSVESIDTRLWRMRIARVFKKIEGMIIGKVTNMQSLSESRLVWGDVENPPTVEQVIMEATEGFDFPILYNVDIGHDVPSLIMPVGGRAVLSCPEMNRLGSIAIIESPVGERKDNEQKIEGTATGQEKT